MYPDSPNHGPSDSVYLEPTKAPQPVYPVAAQQQGIQGQVVLKVAVSKRGDVDKIEVLSGNNILADAAMRAVKKWKFKPRELEGRAIDAITTVTLNFAFKGLIRDTAPNSATQASLEDNAAPVGVAALHLIHKITPVYPEAARQGRIQGTVVLHAIIDAQGHIVRLTPVSGNALLIPAAVGAVQQWIFDPYLIGGKPSEVQTDICVNFLLR